MQQSRQNAGILILQMDLCINAQATGFKAVFKIM